VKYLPGELFDDSRTNRIVEESFAEINGMKRFDRNSYDSLPENIRSAESAIEKQAELLAGFRKRIRGKMQSEETPTELSARARKKKRIYKRKKSDPKPSA
jgi:hypothetical protein